MRGDVRHLDIWLDPNRAVPPLVYLDACDWDLFVDWVQLDNARALNLISGTWRVKLFKHQINRYFGGNGSRTKQLRNLGVDLDEADIQQSDEMFINETQMVYFNNEPQARRRAELLALARRQAGGDKIAIISQHRGFWRIPLVDTYYVDSTKLVGNDDLPAGFDFFVDLGIHQEIRKAAEARLQNGDIALALQQSVQQIYDRLRNLGVTTLDGQDLIYHCLGQDTWVPQNKRNLVGHVPRLTINPFSDSWEEKEQQGLCEIGLGIQRMFRNPLAHKPVTEPYIENRFSNRREVLKILCLISYFIDRIELPKP